MKFAKATPAKIIVLGAGGTAGWLIPHLYRMCHTLNRPIRIIIADGDVIEERNLLRQNFIAADLGQNKAQVLAERYASAFGMEIEYIPSFIEDEEQLAQLVRPDTYSQSPHSYQQSETLSILVACVDNNCSRAMCHNVFLKAKDLVYLDAGNGEFGGQVVLGVKRNGRTYFKPAASLYPDMLDETDRFPTQLSCAEMAVSAPQSITANLTAANILTCFLCRVGQEYYYSLHP